MPEPLKGKYEEYAKGLWVDKLANQRLTHEANEVLDDVKSAVRGLLNEIEELSDWSPDYQDTVISIHDVKKLIKKWFADVVVEDGD